MILVMLVILFRLPFCYLMPSSYMWTCPDTAVWGEKHLYYHWWWWATILVVMMVLSHHWWWCWWLDRLVQGKPALSVLCPVQHHHHHHHHHPRLHQLIDVEYYLFWLRQWKAVFLNLIVDWMSTFKPTDSLSSTDTRMLISLRSSTSSDLCQIYANP